MIKKAPNKKVAKKSPLQLAVLTEKQTDDLINKIQFCSFVLYDFLSRELITPTQEKECQKVLKEKIKMVKKK